MGNSFASHSGRSGNNQRNSTSSLSIPSKKHLLDVKSKQILAPHVQASDLYIECPICFLNFTAFNITTCCKQFICTGCYKALHTSPTSAPSTSSRKIQCPYCNNDTTFCVIYDDKRDFKVHEENKIESPNSHVTASIPIASVDDRKSIEEQILKNQFQYRQEQTTVSRSYESSPRLVGLRRRNQSVDESSFRFNAMRNRTSLTTRFDRLLLSRGPVETNDEEGLLSLNEILSSMRVSNSSESTPSSHLDGLRSIEEIEEILMYEAIQLSLAESQNNNSNAVDTTSV